jgi:hypothetical protein
MTDRFHNAAHKGHKMEYQVFRSLSPCVVKKINREHKRSVGHTAMAHVNEHHSARIAGAPDG